MKFKVRHLEILFKCNRKTLEAYLNRLYKKKDFYKGLERESVRDVAENGREFLCYAYYVEMK